jgi:hypothetical protein
LFLQMAVISALVCAVMLCVAPTRLPGSQNPLSSPTTGTVSGLCTGNAGTGFSNSIRSHTGWISTVSQTDPGFPNNGAYVQLGFDTSQSSFNQFLPLGTLRVSVASATIVYLSMRDFFPTGTDIGWGSIACRRRR